MRRVYLIGYMGVGKTTMGKRLSKSLGLSFIDLDKFMESKYLKTVPDLFHEKGEDEFRKMEQKLLREISQIENVVISTGGGTPCYFDNMDVMNNTGVTVYLKARPEDLAARLLVSRNVRPIISERSPEELLPFIVAHLSQREPFYNRAQIVYEINRVLTKDEIYLTLNAITEKIIKTET